MMRYVINLCYCLRNVLVLHLLRPSIFTYRSNTSGSLKTAPYYMISLFWHFRDKSRLLKVMEMLQALTWSSLTRTSLFWMMQPVWLFITWRDRPVFTRRTKPGLKFFYTASYQTCSLRQGEKSLSLNVITVNDRSMLHTDTAWVGKEMLSIGVAITPRKFSLHLYEILGHTMYDLNWKFSFSWHE